MIIGEKLALSCLLYITH